MANPLPVVVSLGPMLPFDPDHRPKNRMLKTELAGVSFCLKKTRCRCCWRIMPAGERRFGMFTVRPVGKVGNLQKQIQKFCCLPCARVDMVELVTEVRKFNSQLRQAYRADQAYYVALTMSDGDGAEKKIVKKRADKERCRRNNLRKKIRSELACRRPDLSPEQVKKAAERIVVGPMLMTRRKV